MGAFDRIPPEVLTKLLKTNNVGGISGELLEMMFEDIRLVSRPVQVGGRRGKLFIYFFQGPL